MTHYQHIADYYIYRLRKMNFATIREERQAATLHHDYARASRDATFAALFFRYRSCTTP